ncbi:MAG: 50S ribosomal protein L25 [Chitinivibrionales bacterium]|nr:50S ribosomal protein L25 [Chitinivibrionales bacterium]
MDIIKLKARYRSGTGKSYTRKIRQQGWIPAVYYGRQREAKNIEVDLREFATVVRARKTSHLIELGLPDFEAGSASIIKEIQHHVLKETLFYHIDFQAVRMDEKIQVQCPVRIVGKPIGVKEDGGILEHPMRTISIECFPADIPDFIEVDVSNLRVGESIHVKDITVAKCEITASPEEVIAVVVLPHSAEKETAAAEEGAVEGAEGAEGAPAAEGAAVEGGEGKTQGQSNQPK